MRSDKNCQPRLRAVRSECNGFADAGGTERLDSVRRIRYEKLWLKISSDFRCRLTLCCVCTRSAAAQARGYLRLKLECAGASRRDRPVPIDAGLAFYLRTVERAVTVSFGEGETAIEPVSWSEAALAILRRRFTRLSLGVLIFDRLEVFPCGSKKKTKRYRKQVRDARHGQTPPDGQIIRDHPKLITGWPRRLPASTRYDLGVQPSRRGGAPPLLR